MAGADSNILFVRGADRSGGFLEAGNDASRTEHLGDITNQSTANGNHGWYQLAQTLTGAGYSLTQITETAENLSGPSDGLPVAFDALDLNVYDAIVFGSNNAVYTSAQVDAVESYIRGGGGAIFISDANFGGDWADAANSDQQFLDRFGLIMHQDQGTYVSQRSSNDFLVPDHPIFEGVDAFDGEGVSPIEIGTLTSGVSATILARAEGNTRLNEPPFGSNNQGPSRSSNANDGSLLVADADAGRIIGHFDRNTFFNTNGAGTDITRFDNEQYALNLFAYAVGAHLLLPGDANGDGQVTAADLVILDANFGQAGTFSDGDFNGDGVVTAADLVILDANFGAGVGSVNSPPSIAAIPEPTTLALFGLGGLIFARRRS